MGMNRAGCSTSKEDDSSSGPTLLRRGGSADGITSGLDRQNYNVGGEVERIRALYNQFAPRTQTQAMPGSVSSFLTNFGLNLLSQTPRGNIFATAATAAKDPFQTFQAAQLKRRQDILDRRDDIFGTACWALWQHVMTKRETLWAS